MESCAIKVNTILLLLFIIIIILKKAEHPPREKVWPKAVQLQTHQTLLQQGETGEDGHTRLADWTSGVAAIVKERLKLTSFSRAVHVSQCMSPAVFGIVRLFSVVPSCFTLSNSTIFTTGSLINPEDKFNPLFKTILYSLSWVRKLVNGMDHS